MVKLNLFSGLIISTFLAACGGVNPSSSGVIAGESPFAGIYNGREATPQDPIAQSTVLIAGKKFNGAPFNCTGSVLSSTVVLTAGHCVTDAEVLAPESFSLPPERISVLDQNRQSLGVEKILVNPGYLKELEEYRSTLVYNTLLNGYDIALLKLNQPLPDFYRPVVLSTDIKEIFTERSFVAGFGAFRPDVGSLGDYHLRSGVVLMEPAGTSLDHEVVNTPASRLLMYKKQVENSSLCGGDSGGPLYYEKEGRVFQFGVNIEVRLEKGEKRSCAISDKDSQVSAFVAGVHRQFIAETYQNLTGEKLANFDVPAANEDPQRFEFYQWGSRGKSKNSLLDLSRAKIVTTQNTLVTRNYEVVFNIPAKTPRNKICKITALNTTQIRAGTARLDGRSAVSFVKIVNGAIAASFESRVLDKGTKFQVTVLTKEGFVSAILPVVKCP